MVAIPFFLFLLSICLSRSVRDFTWLILVAKNQ